MVGSDRPKVLITGASGGMGRACARLIGLTHDLVLKPGEHAKFVAINKAGFGTFGFMTFLGASPLYLTFERDT